MTLKEPLDVSIVSQYQEHIEHFKPDCRHGKEVDGNQSLEVIVEKSVPGLRRRLAVPEHVLAHAGFADVDAQIEQLTMDVGRAPERVLAAQGPDQIANLTEGPGWPDFPQRTFHVQKRRKPLRCHPITVSGLTMAGAERPPDSPQNHPQEPVDGFQARTFLRDSCKTRIWCRSAKISSSKAARDRNTDRTAASKGRIRSIRKGTTGRRPTLIISSRSEFTMGARSPRGVARPQVDSVRVLN